MFKVSGEITNVVLKVNDSGMCTGCAFVVYREEEDVLSATMNLSEGKRKVQHLGNEQLDELHDLLVEAEAAEKFIEAFKQLTPGRMKAALNSAYRTQLEETTARAKQATKPAATPRMSVKKEVKTPKTPAIDNSQAQAGSSNVWQEIPKLPLFSGLPEKDASFTRWRYEVTCLLKEQQPQNVIRSAIRKSLKSPAAEAW